MRKIFQKFSIQMNRFYYKQIKKLIIGTITSKIVYGKDISRVYNVNRLPANCFQINIKSFFDDDFH